jgi:sialic acid synthase SpsE/mannose-6-phosphate isomerase-like protein (cupin superfamily)
MESRFDFKDLFVLDLANNHQGDVEHGLRIIKQLGAVLKARKVRGAIKFQFRQLDSFVHPSHKVGSSNKHIPRFLDTQLDRTGFQTLLDEVRNQNLIAICTPFDESSVDVIADMGFDVLKVASCSAIDWPLLESIAATGKPVIFSTGGLELHQIDDLKSFFDHRGVDHAIMHCVSIYPTPDSQCNLNNITAFRERYPNSVIGWSTHENPADTNPVMIAVAKGARMFERHVGLATDDISLNAYSSTPEQIDAWISAWRKARVLCGSYDRLPPAPEERDAINGLQRGVFAREPIEKGTIITRSHVYFAMPFSEGQVSSGHWKNDIPALQDIPADGPIMTTAVEIPPSPDVQVLKHAVHEVKALLNLARIPLSSEFEVEYSHHFGMKNFRETGVVIINCINREYCKKILVQLPGQAHPTHFHKRKEETFQVLWGELHTELDERHKILMPGDTQLVMPGVWHRFWSETGCVFEEVSTTHFNDDSVYRDPAINKLERSERKTVVDHWGRFQLPDMAGKPIV